MKNKHGFRLVSQPKYHRPNLICSMQTEIHARTNNPDHIHSHMKNICHDLQLSQTRKKKTIQSGFCT